MMGEMGDGGWGTQVSRDPVSSRSTQGTGPSFADGDLKRQRSKVAASPVLSLAVCDESELPSSP